MRNSISSKSKLCVPKRSQHLLPWSGERARSCHSQRKHAYAGLKTKGCVSLPGRLSRSKHSRGGNWRLSECVTWLSSSLTWVASWVRGLKKKKKQRLTMTAHDIRGRPLSSAQCGPSLNALKSLLQHMLPPTQLLPRYMRGHSRWGLLWDRVQENVVLRITLTLITPESSGAASHE